jgi:hypothetical protein
MQTQTRPLPRRPPPRPTSFVAGRGRDPRRSGTQLAQACVKANFESRFSPHGRLNGGRVTKPGALEHYLWVNCIRPRYAVQVMGPTDAASDAMVSRMSAEV